MGQQTSPNSTPPGMPGVNPAHRGKYPEPHFLTMAAFTAAITPGATGYSADLWDPGLQISIATEPYGIKRVWNGTHARTVLIGLREFAVTADTNVVLATSGAPSSGTGANGDLAIDKAAGVMYGPKASGAWPAGVFAFAVAAASGGGDTVAPGFVSAVVANSTPSIVNVTMSEALATGFVPAASAFAVSGKTVSSVALNGATVNLTLSAAVASSDALTVAYTPPGSNKLQDAAGNLTAAFGPASVANTVAAAPSAQFVRFASTPNTTESGNGSTGWTYTGNGGQTDTAAVGVGDLNLASGQDGWFGADFPTLGSSSGAFIGLSSSSTPGTVPAWEYVLRAFTLAGNLGFSVAVGGTWVVGDPDVGASNGTAVASNTTGRIRVAGTSVIFEASANGLFTDTVTLYTATGQAAAVHRPRLATYNAGVTVKPRGLGLA